MRLRYLFAASVLTMMAGRFLRISPPMEGLKLTHQTSPLFMGAVPEGCFGPFQRFFLAGFILRHLLVSRLELRSDNVRAHEFLDKLADLARPDDLMETFVDLLFDGDRQLFLHGVLPLSIYTCTIRINIAPVNIRQQSIASLTLRFSCGRSARKRRAVSFSRWLDAAAIYVLTMSDLHNTNDKFFIRNRIDNSILALADTKFVLPGHFLAAWRSWI